MNSTRLKSLALLLMLAIAFGCQHDDELPSYVVNNSVKPGDFLSENNYTTLNIEVAYIEGYQPSPTALSKVTDFLAQRLNKPGGITITQRTIPPTGKISIDVSGIREIEKANRKMVTSGKVLTAWVVFLDTEYSESTNTSKVLGISYGASSIAVFEKSVYGYLDRTMPSVGSLETVILDHEFGHILGLVNNGTGMISPHQDTAHGSHCSNTECLMYWKAEENIDLNDLLGDDVLPTLDVSCIADLKANGGK